MSGNDIFYTERNNILIQSRLVQERTKHFFVNFWIQTHYYYIFKYY